MNWRILAAGTVFAFAAAPAAAQRDSAAFVIRLGNDTTVVERYVRTADQIVVEAVQRSPNTMLHRLVYALTPDGRISAGEWTVRAPDGSEPVLRREFRLSDDGVEITTVQGGAPRTQQVVARYPIPMAGPFYTPYELVIMRAVAGEAPKSEIELLPGGNTVQIPVERIGRDSVTLTNQFGEPMRAHVDARGRLLHLHTPAFTTVERIGWVDLDALAGEFAQRDRTGRGLGQLSPRETTRSRVGEANLWLDYSRPAMRGRPIWGALVPWGEVWRMGANDAAHFATDRRLQIGDLTLEPGTYTLFLLPRESGWELIVNRATGIGGLARDAAQDLGRVALTTETVNTPAEQFTVRIDGSGEDARLVVQWDRTRGSAPLRVP